MCRAELRSIRANSGAVAWRKLLAHERRRLEPRGGCALGAHIYAVLCP
jgi:hypothetical protein